MNYATQPTIQDIIDQAKLYFDQGISQHEAIKRAIAASKSNQHPHTWQTSMPGYKRLN